MSSEFAKRLSAKLTADIPPEIVEWGERVIDAELQEVREALAAVVREHDDPKRDYGPTSHTARRARAVLSQLAIPDPPEASK